MRLPRARLRATYTLPMKTAERFVKAFETDRRYATPDVLPLRLCDRLLAWSDWNAYWQMIRICLMGGWQARRGAFNDSVWRDYGLRSLEILERCGIHVEADGLEHVAGLKGPAVIAANHMSIVDTLAGPSMALVFRPVCVVIKSSLLKYPGLGDALRSVRAINVDRVNPRDDFAAVMTQGEERLKRGISVLLFPQATRDTVFHPSQFNSLGAKLAARVGVPLVPLALDTGAWGIGRVFRDFGRIDRTRTVRFRFGSPIPVTGNGRDAHRQSLDFITSTLESWKTPIQRTPTAE